MKRIVSGIIAAIAFALAAASCGSPYDMTDSLGGKALTYSGSPQYSETYTFNAKGTGGDFETKNFTYNYPTAAAAATNDISQKDWFQYSGYRGTFTYDGDTHQIVLTRAYQFARKIGSTTSYKADYQEYSTLDYYASLDSSCTDAVDTVSMYRLFNQDMLTTVFAATGGDWASTEVYAQARTERLHLVQKEWEGATSPATLTPNPATGTATVGAPNHDSYATPLNFNFIDANRGATYTSSYTFQHYGDFITMYTSAAYRGIE